MRFLFEFVSCCGSPTRRPPEPTPAAEEEQRSLVQPAASRPLRRKKRAAPEWRPSLGSISEDNAVPQRERGDPRNAAVGPGRDPKRRSGACAGADAAAKVRHRNYSDHYYGQAAMPTIMPTFSPTPFMF